MPDRKIAQLIVRIPTSLKIRLKVQCARLGVTIQAFCLEAIERHLETSKSQNGTVRNS